MQKAYWGRVKPGSSAPCHAVISVTAEARFLTMHAGCSSRDLLLRPSTQYLHAFKLLNSSLHQQHFPHMTRQPYLAVLNYWVMAHTI